MAGIREFLGLVAPKAKKAARKVKKVLTRSKARKILKDKKIRGKKLTKKQRGLFGAIASGAIRGGAGGGAGRIQKARRQARKGSAHNTSHK